MTGDECGEKLEWLKRVVATAKEHVAFAAQIPECVAMYFSDEFEFENAEAAAVLQEESVPTVMNMLFEELPKLEVLDGPAVKAAFKAILYRVIPALARLALILASVRSKPSNGTISASSGPC